MAASVPGLRLARLSAIPIGVLGVTMLPVVLVVAALAGFGTSEGGVHAVPGIPAQYLALYRAAAARYEFGADGWRSPRRSRSQREATSSKRDGTATQRPAWQGLKWCCVPRSRAG
jgi:hypothetical protein